MEPLHMIGTNRPHCRPKFHLHNSEILKFQQRSYQIRPFHILVAITIHSRLI